MKHIKHFIKMKNEKKKIVMLTSYDFITAKLAEESGVDLILVGDSLGMVVLGYSTTLEVKLDDIIYHSKAVRRGAGNTFIVSDMPYMSYHLDLNTTKFNAAKLILEGQANAVKIEGGSPSRIDVIKNLVDCEIPVVGHLGLTPQSIKHLGSYSVQGKTKDSQELLIEQSKEIEKAGAFMLVLEAIPESLAAIITKELNIPTIGIGAGSLTDGQVLVVNDILNLSDYIPKFAKIYSDCKAHYIHGIKSFVGDVRSEKFPEETNKY